ncbi:capsid protein, partial [Lacticaseibacillus rhamnosus]
MPEFSGATAKLNLVEPKVFADYVLEQQTATNRLLSSGILTTDPIIQAQLLKGGTYVTIPTLQSLSGEAQTWNDTSDITVGNVDSYSAIAPQMYQAKAFGYTDFGQLSTGAPVAEQIAGQFASFWNIQDNKLLIAVLKNAFLNADLQAVKAYGMGTPAPLAAGDFIAALSRMGDVASPQLTKIVLNSAAVGAMRDQNLI